MAKPRSELKSTGYEIFVGALSVLSIVVFAGPVGVATAMSMTPLMRSPYWTGYAPE